MVSFENLLNAKAHSSGEYTSFAQRKAGPERVFVCSGTLSLSRDLVHDVLEMNRADNPPSSKLQQILVSCWAIASFVWYFHRFAPALSPLLHRLLLRAWR